MQISLACSDVIRLKAGRSYCFGSFFGRPDIGKPFRGAGKRSYPAALLVTKPCWASETLQPTQPHSRIAPESAFTALGRKGDLERPSLVWWLAPYPVVRPPRSDVSL